MWIVPVTLTRSQMPKIIYFENIWGTNTQKTRILNSLAAVEILDNYIIII